METGLPDHVASARTWSAMLTWWRDRPEPAVVARQLWCPHSRLPRLLPHLREGAWRQAFIFVFQSFERHDLDMGILHQRDSCGPRNARSIDERHPEAIARLVPGDNGIRLVGRRDALAVNLLDPVVEFQSRCIGRRGRGDEILHA